MSATGIRLIAAGLRLFRPRRSRVNGQIQRILVIRRNRMGDMICTLPLLRALRRRFPQAHLAVACDAAGVPIAESCSAVNRVIPLGRGSKLWSAVLSAPRTWQDFDCVIAVKAGFDRRLAWLARLTNAPRRIGYEDGGRSDFYTDPVAISADQWSVHQIEATLALLAPLGIAPPADPAADLKLDLPASARKFADDRASAWKGRTLVLINLSSTSRLRFREEDFATLMGELAGRGEVLVGLVALPVDLPRAERLAAEAGANARVFPTPGPLELAALMGHARVLVTGEGGGAHLAAAMGTPAVVLWSEGPFEKWYSRGPNHTFVRLEPGEAWLPPGRVRAAVTAHLERGPA